jgi:2-keto-4-pentenoate hydratase
MTMTANALTPALQESVRLLAQARIKRQRLTEIPAAGKPATLAEALAMQDAVTAELGETVGGWKVAVDKNGDAVRGAMFASRIHASPARIRGSEVPLLGVEIEVAFRFDQDLPVRQSPYTAEELAALVTAVPAIEIVDSRFASYRDTPNLDRTADHASFGMLIIGQPEPKWRELDLPHAAGRILADGELLSSGSGNAKAGDPLLPALALANSMRTTGRIRKGHIVTTGTYTPLRFIKPGQRVSARIEGLSEVSFDALTD